MTGAFCTPGQKPECFTNTDPAAVFSAVHSFSGLWKNALSSGPTSYSLAPCEKVGGSGTSFRPPHEAPAPRR